MNADSNNNGSASDTRRPSEHNSYNNLTESEFLTHESELAKTAMSGALNELKSNLAKAGDIKLWAHHYPWMTLGVAAATGFTLATVATGKDARPPETAGEEESRQRMVREAAATPYPPHGSKPKLGDSLLGSLFSLARTALEASLVSAIRTEGAERSEAAMQNAPPCPEAPERGTHSSSRM